MFSTIRLAASAMFALTAATGVDDPMISNSIANRAIREQIVKAFEGRGYVLTPKAASSSTSSNR